MYPCLWFLLNAFSFCFQHSEFLIFNFSFIASCHELTYHSGYIKTPFNWNHCNKVHVWFECTPGLFCLREVYMDLSFPCHTCILHRRASVIWMPYHLTLPAFLCWQFWNLGISFCLTCKINYFHWSFYFLEIKFSNSFIQRFKL